MTVQFQRASKKRAKLRLNLEGQPNAGKTYSSILLAKFLIGEGFKLPNSESRIFFIDTERSTAELYADEFDFNHHNLDVTSPRAYIEAIRAAEAAGAEVIIVDSTSHEWKWCLSEVDRIKPRFGGNKWSAWSEVRPQHDDFLEAILGSRAHVITTTRAKPATVQEEEGGKKKIKQVGMEPIQDEMLPFFFSIVMRLDADHNGVITKTRCKALDGKVYPLPGEAFMGIVKEWLNSGDPMVEVSHKIEDAIAAGVRAATTPTTKEARQRAYDEAKRTLGEWCRARGRTPQETEDAFADMKRQVTEALTKAKGDAAVTHDAGVPKPPIDTNGAPPAQPPPTVVSDEDRMRAIDQGRV